PQSPRRGKRHGLFPRPPAAWHPPRALARERPQRAAPQRPLARRAAGGGQAAEERRGRDRETRTRGGGLCHQRCRPPRGRAPRCPPTGVFQPPARARAPSGSLARLRTLRGGGLPEHVPNRDNIFPKGEQETEGVSELLIPCQMRSPNS